MSSIFPEGCTEIKKKKIQRNTEKKGGGGGRRRPKEILLLLLQFRTCPNQALPQNIRSSRRLKFFSFFCLIIIILLITQLFISFLKE
jgi:hypothetical protein